MQYIFLALILVYFINSLLLYIFNRMEMKKMTFEKLLSKLDKTISNNNSAEAVRLMKAYFVLILSNKTAFAEWLENKQKGGEN